MEKLTTEGRIRDFFEFVTIKRKGRMEIFNTNTAMSILSRRSAWTIGMYTHQCSQDFVQFISSSYCSCIVSIIQWPSWLLSVLSNWSGCETLKILVLCILRMECITYLLEFTSLSLFNSWRLFTQCLFNCWRLFTQCLSRLIDDDLFAHNRPRPILAIEFFQESTRRIQTTDMMDDAINILLLIFLWTRHISLSGYVHKLTKTYVTRVQVRTVPTSTEDIMIVGRDIRWIHLLYCVVVWFE